MSWKFKKRKTYSLQSSWLHGSSAYCLPCLYRRFHGRSLCNFKSYSMPFLLPCFFIYVSSQCQNRSNSAIRSFTLYKLCRVSLVFIGYVASTLNENRRAIKEGSKQDQRRDKHAWDVTTMRRILHVSSRVFYSKQNFFSQLNSNYSGDILL